VTKSESRILGSYYRVGFYGNIFEELDGKEFIYKEPKITRLGEIQERLLEIFGSRFGGVDKIKVFPDSNVVDRSKLNNDFGYLQITSVTPYFEPWELKDRISYYERNYNINRFIFSTPYTKSTTGKAHAEAVKDQWKRKTVLTTESQFPYLKRRLLVINKQEIDVTPLENSIESIVGRTEVILKEVRSSNPTTKTLQPVLQGSILAKVNLGPTQICEGFLSQENSKDWPPDETERLKQGLRDFLKACSEAVILNQRLIGPDQQSFHNELEQGFSELVKFMQPFVGE